MLRIISCLGLRRLIFIGIVLLACVIIAAMIFDGQKKSESRGKMKREFEDAEYRKHFDAMKSAVERFLGPMDNIVGHAIIPFELGGAVDMYYFPNHIRGTGFVTFELIAPDGSGPMPNRIGTYELVTFTKLMKPPIARDRDTNHPFNKIERRMCGIMTKIGRYSFEAVLNPGETCEIPPVHEQPAQCLIFDQFGGKDEIFEIGGHKHSILLCIEVFRSEMDYAMKQGSEVVIKKLKEKGYYPYSDLDRDPVF